MVLTLTGLTHRLATPADVNAIRALTRSAYADWAALLGREPLPMGADYNDAIKEYRFDLLCEGENICALIQTQPRGNDIWIENIAVAPKLHGLGIGRRLLDHVQERARREGFAQLTLYTNAKMARNIDIYKKYGFEIDREEQVAHGTVVHMSLQT